MIRCYYRGLEIERKKLDDLKTLEIHLQKIDEPAVLMMMVRAACSSSSSFPLVLFDFILVIFIFFYLFLLLLLLELLTFSYTHIHNVYYILILSSGRLSLK